MKIMPYIGDNNPITINSADRNEYFDGSYFENSFCGMESSVEMEIHIIL